MASCPVCSAEIKDDFGLVICPSCGSQVLLSIDGVAVSPSPAVPAPPTEIPQPPVTDELSQVPAPPLVSEPLPVDEEPFAEPPPRTNDSPDMRDLAQFANSPVSQGREGFLRFDVYVSGIDTADIREQVKEVLADGKFLWDADKIIGEMRRGEIRIRELTAVKSALLVQRLRTVPVEIRWEQYAIHQS